MFGWDPQGRYVFVTVPRWKLWEMQCDGWMPFKRLFPQERGGLSCAPVLDCWVSDTQSHTAWFFTRGAVVEPLQRKECVRSWELLAAMKKRKDKIVFKCFNAAGYMFVTGGLALCGVNAVPRKGTEAFKGNNLPPPRSNCDISTSLPSCDTLSLQSVPLSVPNNTLQPCRAQQLFFKLLLITTWCLFLLFVPSHPNEDLETSRKLLCKCEITFPPLLLCSRLTPL